MPVTLTGIVIEVKPLQLENASSPMRVTPSGIVISVMLEQSMKAKFPMLVTPCRMRTVLISSRRSYQGAVLTRLSSVLSFLKSHMSPLPAMVRIPVLLRVQIRLSPQSPEAVASCRSSVKGSSGRAAGSSPVSS